MDFTYETSRHYVTQVSESGSKRAITMLAYAIAMAAPMPTTRQDNKVLYFGREVAPTIRGILSEANEQVPVRIGEVIDLTSKIWEHRYQLVYPNLFKGYVNLVLTTETIAPIYHEELKDIIGEDTLYFNHRLMEAAANDFGC